MVILFLDDDLRHMVIQDGRALVARYGAPMAKKIIQRVNELSSARNLGWLISNKIGRAHHLTKNLAGKIALDLSQPFRLILEPVFENGNTDWTVVTKVRILEVSKHYGH